MEFRFRLVMDNLAPSYLAAHCKPTSSCPGRSHLRSATSGQLNFPHTKTDYGKRSFAVNGPVVWNSLPTEFRSPDISLDVFKAKLKTFLFNCGLSAFDVFILILRFTNDLNNNSINKKNLKSNNNKIIIIITIHNKSVSYYCW